MATPRPDAPDPRTWLRQATDALPRTSIGTVPILWQYPDSDAGPGPSPVTILDEIARVGYEGAQFGNGFPEGAALRSALADRGLRLAEVYAALPVTANGLVPESLGVCRDRLRLLHDAGGDVLCVAPRVRRLAHGRAGQQLATTVRVRGDRATGARVRAPGRWFRGIAAPWAPREHRLFAKPVCH